MADGNDPERFLWEEGDIVIVQSDDVPELRSTDES